ncbi:MAG: DsbA family protein [Alphaproteobacteria bacterium]|nr:DsbA family protein [Alphaproteobacteria bacterium]MBV8549504.1 DsbA family protein [Alphaproteobacteria bacterium]
MRIVLVALSLLLTAALPVQAAQLSTNSDGGFSDDDKAAIENVVKEYLTKEHPEVLMEAMKELQRREQATAETKTQDAIKTAKDKIYNDADTPVGGNPKGKVTVVEFFDYQCGYCKMSEEAVQQMLKDNKDVKFIYKDFPILGPMSTTAAKIALAAARQGNAKYIKFHDGLMGVKEHLSEDIIYKVAKDVGLDVEKLKKDAADDSVAKIAQTNVELGTEIGVRGTPMFIIGDKVYPGALQAEQLKKAVEDARKN